MGRTLWDILTGKEEPKEKPMEDRFYNPLKRHIGNTLRINTLDFEGLQFHVQQLREVKREVEEQTHLYADYDLLARPLEGDPVRIRLRLVPLAEPEGKKTHSVLLLKFIEEFKYDKPFHNGLAFEDNQGEFYEQAWNATYWRCNDLQEPWKAKTASLKDEDQNGKVDADEVRHGDLTYWDFSRETTDEGDNKILDYYFVEMEDSGMFSIWSGSEVDQTRIEEI